MGYLGEKVVKRVYEPLPDELDVPVEPPVPQVPEPAQAPS